MGHEENSAGARVDVFAGVGLGLGLWLFYSGFKDLRLRRTISGLATSKARSLAMGLVELSGRTEGLDPLQDPIYQLP